LTDQPVYLAEAVVMNERDLFFRLEIEDLAARRAHLQAACADNGELLSRDESLLASHEGESRYLQTPVGEQLGDDPTGQPAATIVMGTGSTQDESPSGEAASILDFSQLQERTRMSDEIPLGYLEPPTKPGSLGRLAHYEILEVIGQGAFGTVLRAFDEKLQRVVAIKVMAPELAATSPARKRFVREAQASAQIRHEHVVSVYSVEEKPIPYLVMEYIPGVTLQQRSTRRDRSIFPRCCGWEHKSPKGWRPPMPRTRSTATSSRATSCWKRGCTTGLRSPILAWPVPPMTPA
jgi:hypothetical protein